MTALAVKLCQYAVFLWVGILATTTTFCHAQDEFETAPKKVVASVEITLKGEDLNAKCPEWAEGGECQSNPSFMIPTCPISCGSPIQAMASIYQGEDAALGAVRFAEEHGLDDPSQLLEIVEKLVAAGDSAGYEPPQELIRCTSGGKSKPCSAGKLWKRAEESRGADLYDAAAADLIRALSKSGIEVDFVERCHKSLQWAIGSIQRQRERERREAEEEAKLEKRRQEEQLAAEESLQRKKEYEAAFAMFGDNLKLQPSASATIEPDGSVQVDKETEVLSTNVKKSFVENDCSEVLIFTKKLSPSSKDVDLLLIEARCHELQGSYKPAMSAAGKVIQKAATYREVPNDSPIILAMQLGANSAMQLGLSENALSFYQTVLKLDPEQERARKQYRGLKKVTKLLDKAQAEVRLRRSRVVLHLSSNFSL